MHSSQSAPFNLVAAAHASMIEHGFQPEFPAGAAAQLAAIEAHPELPTAPGAQDLRGLLWSSIDNDTSKDLDQIEWAEQLPDGRIRVLVGVADVDVRVGLGTVLDGHARSETTSVYTGVKVFPMLPVELSEGITSLNESQDRVAHVIEFSVDSAGTVADGKVYAALVRNRAQLRGRVARVKRPGAREGRRRFRPRRAAQTPGRRGPAHGGQPLPTWRA
jgi:exoribonuclease-2